MQCVPLCRTSSENYLSALINHISGRTITVHPLLIKRVVDIGLWLAACDVSVLFQQRNKHRGCSWYQNVADLSVNLLQKFES